MGQHYGELVAAETRARVADAHFVIDTLRHLAQYRIAGQMPVLVVDALEVIDVDHQARDGQMFSLRARQLFAQAGV